TLKTGEDAESIVLYYVTPSGELTTMRGKYTPSTETVDFVTPPFSQFLIGYNKVSFADVPAGRWYSEAVGFLAARSIVNGTGEGLFSPGAAITRGQFIVLLMRAYGIQPE